MELLFLLLLSIPPNHAFASAPSAHPAYAAASACGLAAGAGAAAPERREEHDGGRILDISHYYREDMPAWESAAGTGQFLRLLRSMRNGSDIANFSELRLSAHSGTHVDAPGHVFEHYFGAGFDVDTLDLGVLNGPALLVDVPRDTNITAKVMESLHIPKGVRRVLFRTLNTDRKLMWKKEFDTSYVGFMEDGAQWLVRNTDIKLVGFLAANNIPHNVIQVKDMTVFLPRSIGFFYAAVSKIADKHYCLGVDYLSVGAFDECIPAHLVFLEKREIILVEALNLEHVTPGVYSLHCLPLRLRGAEGSPARCILIK